MRLLIGSAAASLLGGCVAKIWNEDLLYRAKGWYGAWDGPFAPTIIPLTSGWEEADSYVADWPKGSPAGVQAAWNSSDSPLALFRSGQLNTALGDQVVSFLFIGSGIAILGNYRDDAESPAPTPRLVIDGVSYDRPSANPNVTWYLNGPVKPPLFEHQPHSRPLLEVGGLAQTWHNMTIITRTAFSGSLSITGGQFVQFVNRTEFNPDWRFTQGNAGNLLPFANDAVDSRLETVGNVSVHTYTQFKGAIEDYKLFGQTMDVACLRGDASVAIRLPINSSWVAVQGLLAPNYGVLTTTLDPPPPSGGEMWSFSTNRSYLVQDDYLIQVPLDPAVRYKLKMATEAATSGEGVYLKSTMIIPYDNSTREYWIKDDPVPESQASSDAPVQGSRTLRPGAIAGITVGCALLLALLGALWFVLRKKYVVRRVDTTGVSWREADPTFEIEDESSSISPFLDFAVPHSGHGSEKGPMAVSVGRSVTTIRSPGMGSIPAAKPAIVADIIAGRYTRKGRPQRRTLSRPVQIVQEDDGGSVDGGDEDNIERHFVPPRYNPAWEHRRNRPDEAE